MPGCGMTAAITIPVASRRLARAAVEAGSPAFGFGLHVRNEIWAGTAAEIYRQAAAGQWDPQTAVDWDAPFELPPAIEAAVVQVMTYLIGPAAASGLRARPGAAPGGHAHAQFHVS
jgi:hypothetical protein